MINVNDFVRIYNCGIRKIREKTNTFYFCDEFISNGIEITSVVYDAEIIKHGASIIEVLEIGDYINGQRLLRFKDNYVCVENSEYLDGEECIAESEIKSVVTHEEFNQIKYSL